jgi:hypothetical protein
MIDQIVVATCPGRKYIYQTLESIHDNIPIIVVMDSVHDFLPDICNENITKKLRTYEHISDATNLQKAASNYCRCLTEAKNKNTLIIEDDIVFKGSWQGKFIQYVNYIETTYKEYVLSISHRGYKLGGKGVGPSHIDYGLVREPQQVITSQGLLLLANTQARYYPSYMTKNYDKIITYLNAYNMEPYDLVLDRFFYMNKIKLFVSQVPLTSHLGKESTIGTPTPEY